MKTRDHPTGRTSPIEDEPIIIEMSFYRPEEAGANGRSRSPDYEKVEEAEMLMKEA